MNSKTVKEMYDCSDEYLAQILRDIIGEYLSAREKGYGGCSHEVDNVDGAIMEVKIISIRWDA